MKFIFLQIIRIKYIRIVLYFSFAICYGQKDTISIPKAEKMKRPIAIENDLVKFEIPKNDFIVFDLENDERLFTGKIDFAELKKSAESAICCMGIYPPVNVSFYNNGCITESIGVRSSRFATALKQIKVNTETFNNLSDYEEKRKQILSTSNTYMIEKKI